MADARALGNASLLADALHLRGQCQASSGRFEEALADHRESVLMASAAKHDPIAAQSAVAIVAAAARSGRIADAETSRGVR